MFKATIAAVLISASAASAGVNDVVAEYRAEIEQLLAEHDAWLSYNNAPPTLAQAFEAAGIGQSMNYVPAWGSSMYLDWSVLRDLYGGTAHRLGDWRVAVQFHGYDEDMVIALLDTGMARLRAVHAQVPGWFRDDIANYVERAQWLDLKFSVECCGGLHEYYGHMADNAFADSNSPSYGYVASITTIPPVPSDNQGTYDWPADLDATTGQLLDRVLEEGGDAALGQALGLARTLLELDPSPSTQEFLSFLDLLAELDAFSRDPVGPILDHVEALPNGSLRDALLELARDGMLDRVGHLAPLLAAQATTPEGRSAALVALTEEARRVSMLRDDLSDPISPASGPTRAISGLAAASGILNAAASGDVDAEEYEAIVNNLAGTLPGPVSPTAPFAGPFGAVAAQAGQTASAFDLAGQALDGINDAIDGDPTGLDRAQAAANALEQALDPRVFVSNMADGFVDGVVGNIPFARSILGWISEG